MKNTIVVIVAIILAAGVVVILVGRSKPAPEAAPVESGLANPASVNCVETLGGTLSIVDEPNGQVGYCHLPDGRVCEEWSLFRNGVCQSPTSPEF